MIANLGGLVEEVGWLQELWPEEVLAPVHLEVCNKQLVFLEP